MDGEPFELLLRGPADGPLVLCLHGFPDVPATWDPVMERLADAGYRCAAPYLRGYAPSTTRGPFDVDRLGADVVGLAAALSSAPAHLLGHDWGAVVACAALARAPERFRSAVTVAVPHPAHFVRSLARNPSQIARSGYMAFFQLPALPERALRRGLVTRLWRRWSPGFEPPPGHLEEVVRTLSASAMAPLEYYRAVPAAGPRILRWPRIRTPMLYLHGLDDGCVAPRVADGQERFFAGRHRTELLCTGHFAPLEDPDRVAELALRHLSRA